MTLAETMIVYLVNNFSATYSLLLCCITIIDYNRLMFDTRELCIFSMFVERLLDRDTGGHLLRKIH